MGIVTGDFLGKWHGFKIVTGWRMPNEAW